MQSKTRISSNSKKAGSKNVRGARARQQKQIDQAVAATVATAAVIRSALELAYRQLPEGFDLEAFDAEVWALATAISTDEPPGSPWRLEPSSGVRGAKGRL